MGRMTSRGLAGALFSQVQLRLLALLFGNPDRRFHASELIRLASSGSGAVQRELKKLAAAGLLTVTSSGNRKFYQANGRSPIFGELHRMILKTAGLAEPLRNALADERPKIAAAFVYGSVAKGTDTASSDIDVMIIGDDLHYGGICTRLHKAEKVLERPVNPTVLSIGDWRRRISRNNPFVLNLLRQPKLFLFGTEHELAGTRESG
jgi:predicted nucleotidyltransferase